MRVASSIACLAFFAAATPLLAAESVAYSYDSKGRVIKAVHTGGPSSGVTLIYFYDKAGNRTVVKVTGAH